MAAASSVWPLGLLGGGGDSGGGSSVQPPTGSDSTTSGTTTATTTATTTTSGSAGERPRDFHPFMVLPTAPVAEEEDVSMELEEDRVEKLKHVKGRGPWTYSRELQTGSSAYTSVSSSSGTVSTYTSSGSHLSTIPTEATIHLELEEDVYREEMERKAKQIKRTVQEFFCAPSSSDSGINGGDAMASVLERWFTELGVGWVLHLPVADGAGKLERTSKSDVWSWIQALAEVMETFHFATSATESDEQSTSIAQFFQETLLKMLPFVDLIVSEVAEDVNVTLEPYEKLSILWGLRGALCEALPKIWVSFQSPSPPPAQVERIQGEMASLLSSKQGKVSEAMWSTMEDIRTRMMESVEDGNDSETPQGSSDIHKATRSVIIYIRFLHTNYSSVAPIVSEAASLGMYVPPIGDVAPLTSLITEMASCVEEKLANKSADSFTYQSLRFLFLLNNSYFIWQQNLMIHHIFGVSELPHKVEGYMNGYLQASWEPVVTCLFNAATPLCYGRTSLLSKFESEFQKTYTTQKLWKVPDPVLRKTLREAIIEKIIPSYTKYIKENKITTLKFTPQNLQEMLQELFEG